MITGYELIEKIQKGEIKSETYIKCYNKEFDSYGDLYFHGNWFSKEPYYVGIEKYDGIVAMLCDKNLFYEIIDNEKELKKLEIKDNKIIGKWKNGKDYCYTLSAPQVVIVNKLNQVINYINRKEDN